MNDRSDQLEPKVGDENRGLAMLLAVIAVLFFVLLGSGLRRRQGLTSFKPHPQTE